MVSGPDPNAATPETIRQELPQEPDRNEGITLLVVDGPHDGLVHSDRTSSVTIGREAGTVTLPLDPQVSRQHCVIRHDPDDARWLLLEPPDRPSANGTWIEGQRITEPQALVNGSVFVIGTTAVRCRLPADGESFQPEPERLERDVRAFADHFDRIASRGLGAARMLALQEQSTFLTARHVFLGLVSAAPETSSVSHGKGLISRRFLEDRVRADDYWTDSSRWIAQLVSIGKAENSLFFDQLTTTPRVYRAMSTATSRATEAGYDQTTTSDLLVGLFDDPDGRLREWFIADGGDVDQLVAALARTPPPACEAPPAPKPASEHEPEGVAAASRPPRPRLVDPAVVDLAAATRTTAAKYRLASAQDRRTALKDRLTQAIAGLAAERRQLVLEQLRDCFPIAPSVRLEALPATERQEVEELRRRVAELEGAVSAADTPPPVPRSNIPWSEVLSPGSEISGVVSVSEDARAVELLQQLVTFSVAIERFVISIVAGLTQQTSSISGIATLPGFDTTIRRTMNLSFSGQPLPEGFKSYLEALETWLVTTIAAYHAAPEEWFTRYWKKTAPSRIEAKVPAKIAREAKCWSHYKNIVRRISPDLVGDEIQARVREIAQEKFVELIERRS